MEINQQNPNMGHVFMNNEDDGEIEVRGHDELNYMAPMFCVNCTVTDRTEQLTPPQMADHLELIHKPRGHYIRKSGLSLIKHMADLYKSSREAQRRKQAS